MSFDLNTFICESNLIDKQFNYYEDEIIPGAKPGDLMYDNQMIAYSLAMDKIASKNLTANDVLDIHRELTRGVDFFEIREMSGILRKVDLSMNNGTKTFPKSGLVHWLLYDVWTPFYADCIAESKSAKDKIKEKLSYEIHDMFECIHPFIDGNGRTGRILLNAARVQMGLEPITIFYKDRFKYYSNIQKFEHEKYQDIVFKYNTLGTAE